VTRFGQVTGVLLVASCAVTSVDLDGKDCPCASDYVCDLATNHCVRPGEVSDGGASDAVAPLDGPTLADGGGSCPGHPKALFCDDFDEGPLGAAWGPQTGGISPLLSLSDAMASSPPSSLFVAVPAAEAGSVGAALLAQGLPTGPILRSSFDVYLDQLTNRSAEIGSLYQVDGTKQYDITLLANTAGMSIFEDTNFDAGASLGSPRTFSPTIPLKTWTRVIFDVDYGAQTFSLTLEIPPGTTASPVLDRIPIHPPLVGKSTALIAGVDDIGPPRMAELRMYVDNVVLETAP